MTQRSMRFCCAVWCELCSAAAARTEDVDTGAQRSGKKPAFSAGGGALFLSDLGGGVDFSVPIPSIAPAPYNGWTTDITMKTPYYGGGVYGFFDARYAEALIAYFAGAPQCSAEGSYLGNAVRKDNQFSRNRTIVSALSFELLGKYPFDVSPKLRVFPLIGAEYRLALVLKEESGGSDPNLSGIYSGNAVDFSALWFHGGAGLDYKISKSLFIRAEILYGIRLPNKAEKEIIAGFKDKARALINAEVPEEYRPYINPRGSARTGHGPSVKLAVGRSF